MPWHGHFVTGATGFIGGEVVKQLVGRGHQVSALVRTLDGTELLTTLGVKLHIGDITSPATLGPPMIGVDGVFHIAAWYEIGAHNPLAERVNVDGTRNVLQAMGERGVPRGVYTSTVAVSATLAVSSSTRRFRRAVQASPSTTARSGRRTTKSRCR